jgi:pantetheine-phosphate adenylyltransferase
MARYPVAVLGGTFDRLHIGHEALLNSAFRVGRDVGIGLTTAAFLRGRAKPLGGRIAPYARRHRTLAVWLRRHHPDRTWWIAPLKDPLGQSVEPGVDAIVVSVDTRGGGRAVNRERRRRGLPPVAIVLVPLVLADDFRPVSSRRIRAGIIDCEGRRLSRIAIRAHAPTGSRDAVRAALNEVYRRPAIRWSGLDRSLPASEQRVERRSPSEIDIEVVPPSPTAPAWKISVQAGRIRLPAIRVPAAAPGELREAIARRLRPRATRVGRSTHPPGVRVAYKH